VICLLPALALLVLIKIICKRSLDWRRLLIGIILPSLIFLIWQFLITFGPAADSKIEFAPLLVMSHFSSFLLPKFLLSIVFPLIVTVLGFKKAIKDRKIQLGWLGFIVSLQFLYLFSETGVRQFAANFYWSAEITLFLLFFACIMFLSENKTVLRNPIKKWLILVSGFLHILFGIIFYVATIT
jgi:hypothetical protein